MTASADPSCAADFRESSGRCDAHWYLHMEEADSKAKLIGLPCLMTPRKFNPDRLCHHDKTLVKHPRSSAAQAQVCTCGCVFLAVDAVLALFSHPNRLLEAGSSFGLQRANSLDNTSANRRPPPPSPLLGKNDPAMEDLKKQWCWVCAYFFNIIFFV